MIRSSAFHLPIFIELKLATKYLLVKNERGTEKYQPVGGVYKLAGNEKIELKNRYQVKDDDKISIDESSPR